MTTPADELRTAAQKLRTLATAASTGRADEPTGQWAFTETRSDSGEGHGSGMLRATDNLNAEADPRLGKPLIHGSSGTRGRAPSLVVQHGDYIAATDPTLGLLVADWLASAAEDADQIGPDHQALAVARQINASTP
ncbi:hypothetical protein [Streptomyces scopuliridis]|uniref:Uncharacterized protein n=1 Tax=Streptomyces scopuliridis TaxID=452529 RepID=A0ACD4ZP58_9ACTN|nr:hypothetical protein [Streptomyces scopuliridis]WSC00093.1 hypothetical protein OG835_25915 [Streptomyces scopuliridis]